MANQFLFAVMSAAALTAAALTVPAAAEVTYVTRTCQGNIETGSRQIAQTGVSYKLSYEISGSTAKIRFAGREFDAQVETGKSWTGPWVKRMDNEIYFSYLPEDGGTIKFQFAPDRWYSGNC